MFQHHRGNNINNSNMSRSRYEPVPQADEIIELHNDPNYNYNTAIPNSPPPSFHSSQSTPAVSVVPDDFAHDHDRAFNNTTPRPIPSVIGGGDASATTTGNDAATVITNLHRRVDRLEETIGRLLLEKSESDSPHHPFTSASAPKSFMDQQRSNCCVTFPDISSLSSTERAELLHASSSNCCVRFGGRRSKRRGFGGRGFGGGGGSGGEGEDMTDEERRARRDYLRQWLVFAVGLFVVLIFMAWITALVWLRNRPRVVGCEMCAPGAVMGAAAGSGAGGAWSAAGQGEDGAWSSSG